MSGAFSELDEYGACVIRRSNEEEETQSVLMISRESRLAVVGDFLDSFERIRINGVKGIEDAVQSSYILLYFSAVHNRLYVPWVSTIYDE